MKHLTFALVPSALLLLAAVAFAQDPVRVGSFSQGTAQSFFEEDGLPSGDVKEIHLDAEGPIALTDAGAVRYTGTAWEPVQDQEPRKYCVISEAGVYRVVECLGDASGEDGIPVRQVAFQEGIAVAAATDEGLFVRNESGLCERVTPADGEGRHWAVEDVRGVAVDAKGRLWFATRAGVGRKGEEGWEFFTGDDGLPYNDFTCMAAGNDGSVWFGTRRGAILYKDGTWRYRQGRRWLPDDEVRAIAVDDSGTAWIATAGGVGSIGWKPMTLAEKAAFYEQEMELIKRTEYGYTSEVGLKRPGDKSEVIYTDSDNDGLWTAMYGAGECFAYGATKDSRARERAQKAFEALRFLQKVTQTGEIRPPKGYVARTILPTDGHDPNAGRVEGDREHREKRDSLWKIYEPRWPKSGDGKWYWKSDTSSDELDGHYFFYPAYYDCVAETEEEKERVRRPLGHDRIGACDDLADRCGGAVSRRVEEDVGLSDSHFAKEDFPEFIVEVLPRVDERVVRIFVEDGDDARELDDLRSCADNGHDFHRRNSPSKVMASPGIRCWAARSSFVSSGVMTKSPEPYSRQSAFPSRSLPSISGSIGRMT